MALETKVSTWHLGDGAPQPGAQVTVRAVYDDTNIYFIFQWPDKTRQERMGQWFFSDGRWQAEEIWADALALHWQITEQVKDFKQGGCAVLCHSTGRFREFPRMATRQESALVDEWYWNAFTTQKAGRPGDGFLDHRVRYVPQGSSKPALRWAIPALSAAHASDTSGERVPQNMGGIPLIFNVEETEGMPPHPRFYKKEGERVPLQLSEGAEPAAKIAPLYEAGNPEGGDSANIKGRAAWSDGYWTLKFSRKLRTSSGRDVQLDPPEKSYCFGLAVWDGTAGDQHQVGTIVRLRFEPME
jgi:hypothetical protein